MDRKYPIPAQQAAFNQAFEQAFNETISKVLAISSLPGVTPAQATAFVERGLDVKDVARLDPVSTMQRALKTH